MVRGYLILIIIFIGITPAYGSDYFENFSTMEGWFYEPIVCIVDAPDKHEAIGAVKYWERVFDYLEIEGYGYDVYMRYITESTEGCNITVNFVNEEDVRNRGGTPLGTTQCMETNTILYWVGDVKHIIREGDRFCWIYINPSYANGTATQSVLIHEMGHALGIGHRAVEKASGFAYIVETNDIMGANLVYKPLITEESIDALQYFYGYNGWNGIVNYDNYTIPH